MPSHFPDLEYDIFISYRQNDNRYDGWVTEFVNNLKKELDATIKYRLSVYFDENPEDGLLESHSVDKSLENKLKCAVFIPVLSRTYCDPESFAWNREFIAFLRNAKNDNYGLDIRLGNGNVSSRILPVRIHDLDKEDTMTLQDCLGPIRSIDFIYKSPGVNRPLRANEDHPHDNLTRTYYRDQINKTAIAISEILSALRRIPAEVDLVNNTVSGGPGNAPTGTIGGRDEKYKLRGIFSTMRRKRIISLSTLISLTALFILFIFSGGSSMPFESRDWIVISDFTNLTDERLLDKSLSTAFTISIDQSRHMNVLSRSMMIDALRRMKIRDATLINEELGRNIASREGIKLYIVPSVGKIGDDYILSARILETETGKDLKSIVLYASSKDKILPNLDQLSRKVRRALGESRYKISKQDKPLAQVTTKSLEALRQYSLGIEHHLQNDFDGARYYYENALRIDTGFTAAKASLGNILIEQFNRKEGIEILRDAVRQIDDLTEKEKLGILGFYSVNVEKDLPMGIKYTKMRIELYPDDPLAHNNLGWYCQNNGQTEEALAEYIRAVSINPSMSISYRGIHYLYLNVLGKPDSALMWAQKMTNDNPDDAWSYDCLGSSWLALDSLKKAERAFTKAREINPRFILNNYRLAHTLRLMGRYNEAVEILQAMLETNPEEASAFYDMAINYEKMNKSDEARKSFLAFKKVAVENWPEIYPGNPFVFSSIASVAAHLGETVLADDMLRKAYLADSTLYMDFAEIYSVQGRKSDALEYFDKALKNGYRDCFWIKMNPDLDLIRNEPEFRKLMFKYFQ